MDDGFEYADGISNGQSNKTPLSIQAIGIGEQK
jgi:hypothetical protein